jgi:hypothetical protein
MERVGLIPALPYSTEEALKQVTVTRSQPSHLYHIDCLVIPASSRLRTQWKDTFEKWALQSMSPTPQPDLGHGDVDDLRGAPAGGAGLTA